MANAVPKVRHHFDSKSQGGLMLPGSFAGGIGGERCLFWRGWWISGIKNY